MIGRLRKRFILVAMCSMAAVLTVIVGSLNLVSYINMVSKADAILELLAENDAAFPKLPVKPENMEGEYPIPLTDIQDFVSEEQQLPAESRDTHRGEFQKMRPGMSPETPYETRFFSVKYDTTGQLAIVDTGKIAAVETGAAVTYAGEVLESGRKRGFYENYRFCVTEKDDGIMVVFMDRSRELTGIRTLAVASASMSLLGMFTVYVLVLIFSKKVFKPVAASYAKQKQFITDAGHELKTPLTIISANVEVLELERGEDNPWLKSISNQVARLSALVEQLVTLSRMDEREALQETCDFVFSEAVRETGELFRVAAANKHITLTVEAEGQQLYHGDEKQIRQMLSLLLDNAVKYTPEGGQIQMTFCPKGRHMQLLLRNTAEGLPKGNLDILFERFYRLDSSRSTKTGGSGIGLSIVKSIVEAHKGRITAYSEDGASLMITVVL